MRSKMIGSTSAVLIVIALAGTTLLGQTKGSLEQRVSNLETRVATLETFHQSTNGDSSEDSSSTQQSNTSSSSSQSSVSVSSSQEQSGRAGEQGSYSGSFTSTGDNAFEFEIDSTGTYTLTATVDSPFTLYVEGADNEPIPHFTLESETGGTLTTSGDLDPGTYTLRVNSSSMWNVTITSISD